MSWRDQLLIDLEHDEGVKLHPYLDSVGKTTIGIGRNLDDNGITIAEARMLCQNDVNKIEDDLDNNIPWWRGLPDEAKRALANMAFNMGWPRLSHFTKMLTALEAGDYTKAALEALDSKWASQVGARSHRIADLYRQAGR